MDGLIGIKIRQEQAFLEDGTRVPITLVRLDKTVVTQIKMVDKDGYSALQIGMGEKKKVNKPLQGHFKKASLTVNPRHLKEIRIQKDTTLEIGSEINPEEIIAPGDVVKVIGTSKGKGYAGVVKRYHFKGGPKTHGQSDRHRAPGSSGQSTTPGRVYKGKRMSGRMGDETVSVKNLQVINLAEGVLSIIGLVPGVKGSVVTIIKTGVNKKFTPLYSPKSDETEVDVVPEEVTEAVVVSDDSSNITNEPVVAVESAPESESIQVEKIEAETQDKAGADEEIVEGNDKAEPVAEEVQEEKKEEAQKAE